MVLWMEPLHRSWQENIRTTPPPPPYYTVEVYDETPIFIPVEITEDVVESVTQKLSGSLVPGCTDSEALQG